MIRFRYCTYDVNGNLVPRRNGDGDIKTYLADPYHLMYKNSKYYLLCHMHRYDSLSYLHVERIRDLSIEGPDHSLNARSTATAHAGATVRHRAAYERATLSDGRQGDADPHEDPRGA